MVNRIKEYGEIYLREEKIVLTDDEGNEVEMYVVEETRINNVNYILVTEEGDEEEEIAHILKDVSDEIIECILDISQGDSRIALNYLELYKNSCTDLKLEEVLEIFRTRQASYHKAEDKYNLISAMIKSMRGSDPDSALYWLGRLLAGGEDPRYIARRLVVHASEDIGMANPEAMLVANSAMMASE